MDRAVVDHAVDAVDGRRDLEAAAEEALHEAGRIADRARDEQARIGLVVRVGERIDVPAHGLHRLEVEDREGRQPVVGAAAALVVVGEGVGDVLDGDVGRDHVAEDAHDLRNHLLLQQRAGGLRVFRAVQVGVLADEVEVGELREALVVGRGPVAAVIGQVHRGIAAEVEQPHLPHPQRVLLVAAVVGEEVVELLGEREVVVVAHVLGLRHVLQQVGELPHAAERVAQLLRAHDRVGVGESAIHRGARAGNRPGGIVGGVQGPVGRGLEQSLEARLVGIRDQWVEEMAPRADVVVLLDGAGPGPRVGCLVEDGFDEQGPAVVEVVEDPQVCAGNRAPSPPG